MRSIGSCRRHRRRRLVSHSAARASIDDTAPRVIGSTDVLGGRCVPHTQGSRPDYREPLSVGIERHAGAPPLSGSGSPIRSPVPASHSSTPLAPPVARVRPSGLKVMVRRQAVRIGFETGCIVSELYTCTPPLTGAAIRLAVSSAATTIAGIGAGEGVMACLLAFRCGRPKVARCHVVRTTAGGPRRPGTGFSIAVVNAHRPTDRQAGGAVPPAARRPSLVDLARADAASRRRRTRPKPPYRGRPWVATLVSQSRTVPSLLDDSTCSAVGG